MTELAFKQEPEQVGPAPNEQQAAAISGLTEFLLESHGAAVLAGSAGTGKTFCMRQVRENCKAEGLNLIFTAPTNKATKVLREAIGDENCITTYSLLGLQLQANGEVKSISQREHGAKPIEEADAVVVDEGSMNSRKLEMFCQQARDQYKIPFVYLGDACQLPPVGEKQSVIWDWGPPDYELTKVMRFDNQILQLATRLREYVKFPIGDPGLLSDNANGEGVFRVPGPRMVSEALDLARSGAFQSGKAKAIAWRNVVVDSLNSSIRKAIGTQDLAFPWSPGDRVVSRAPCFDMGAGKKKGECILHTDDECLVENIYEAKHPWFAEYECFLTELKSDSGKLASVWTVHPRSAPFLANELKRLAEDARKNPTNWKHFWMLKEAFHDVGLAYAITAHRSQGSTYEHAFVDAADILRNREREEAAKCLYVACSRPSKRLTIGG